MVTSFAEAPTHVLEPITGDLRGQEGEETAQGTVTVETPVNEVEFAQLEQMFRDANQAFRARENN